MLTSSKQIKKENEYDIGLAIIRPILSFFVVMTHCYTFNYLQGKWRILYINSGKLLFHVPTFFIIAFYFSYKTLISRNYKKKLERFQRLFIPYIFWPIIICLLNRILIKFIRVKLQTSFQLLIHQLLFGNGYIDAFWFQWNLIIITLFYIIIIRLFKKHYTFILIVFHIFAFNYQYNGKNLYFVKFQGVTGSNFGRLLEMIPYSIIGFLLSSSEIIKYLKKYRIKNILICIYFIYFLMNYKIFNEIKGFAYNGLKLYFLSITIFFSFTMFPSENIKNQLIIRIIKQITNHTAGVYFIHYNIYIYMKSYILNIKNKTIKGCIIIYLISYFICFIGNLLFRNTKLRYLFI